MQKRSLSLHGHHTSVALEEDFWTEIDAEITHQKCSFAAFICRLDDARIAEGNQQGLASYLRLWVLHRLKARI